MGINKCREYIHELKNTFHFSSLQLKLVMSENDPSVQSVQEREALVKHQIFATLPYVAELSQEKASRVEPFVKRFPEEKYSRVIRYLAREESGILVGLALGSGAAFGLAHIGVLRVLEREKIPIDILSGSSIGALVSVFWAAGFDSFQLEQIALDLASKKKSFWNIVGPFDFSMPHQGFFKGHTISQYLKRYLGDKTFRDLKVPVRVIAMNLFSTEEVVFEEGSLVEAIRASISIPGILRPVALDKRYLIDGGVVEPVPVRVLSSAGIRKIIAVNVLQGPRDRLERMKLVEMKRVDEEQKLKSHRFKRWLTHVKESFFKRYEANIFNVLMHTIQSMEYAIASHSCREADVALNPVSPDSNWIEFYNPKKFIQMGIEETEKHLDKIKSLVNEL
jgi:NTE family protein